MPVPRNLVECRVFTPPRGLQRTLVAFPAPVPQPEPRPAAQNPRRRPPAVSVRSPFASVRNPCLYLPDLEAAEAFVAIRKQVGSDQASTALPPLPRTRYLSDEARIGLWLCVLPPMGVMFLWAHRGFSDRAKTSITAFVAFCHAVVATAAALLLMMR